MEVTIKLTQEQLKSIFKQVSEEKKIIIQEKITI